jgi:hypothetical protein
VVYFGKRFYAPMLQRWISADPLAVHVPGEADLNLYAYVSGKALKSVDPLGLEPANQTSAGHEPVRYNADGSVQTADGRRVFRLDEITISPRDPTKTSTGEDLAGAYEAAYAENDRNRQAQQSETTEKSPAVESWLDRPVPLPGAGMTWREAIKTGADTNPYGGGAATSGGKTLLGRAFNWLAKRAGLGDEVTQVAMAGGPAGNVYRIKAKAPVTGASKPQARVAGDALRKMRAEFEKMRPEIWKSEAAGPNAANYSAENLARMRQGKAPIGRDGYPMEIHHKRSLAEGGSNTMDNFDFLTRTDHRLGPNYKKNHPRLP